MSKVFQRFWSTARPEFAIFSGDTKIYTVDQSIIYGDGEASRDFTYVANVVNANLLACTAKDAVGEVFNIACGVSVAINQLVQKITDLCGNNIKPIYKDPRLGDVKNSYASIEKARVLLIMPRLALMKA